MSRLIFEGNTRERFGDLFPRPIIEEIKVFDNNIEVDVALYFEIEEDISADNFAQIDSLLSLRVFTGLVKGKEMQQIFDNNSLPLTAIVASRNQFGIINNDLGLEPTKSSFFYNSEGKKYIKFLLNYIFDAPRRFDDEIYVTSITKFFSNEDFNQDPVEFSKQLMKLDSQHSDLSYEKLYNSDSSIVSEKIVRFIESDGNFYSKTPLMSLDRNYRKTDLINHTEVYNTVNSIIEPFVGDLEEANLISSTLSTNLNKPRLLIALQRNINNFSNKSSATTVGALYGDLVDAISNIDSILISSEVLQKRLIPNAKIKNFRNTINFNFIDKINISTEPNDTFIHLPLVTREYKRKTIPATSDDDYCVENNLILFFDYEKSLNFESEISKIFNPYNLIQIFGFGSLNKFFKFNILSIKKLNPESEIIKSQYLINYDNENINVAKQIKYEIFSSSGNGEINNFIEMSGKGEGIVFGPVRAAIVERAFDTLDGLNNYGLKTYQITNIESVYSAENYIHNYLVEIEIIDTTMQFYDEFIYKKMFDLKNNLEKYFNEAQQFCSYNNLDNVFNKFFIDSVNETFSFPYIWQEAPLYFYAIKYLIQSSYENMDINNRTPYSGKTIDKQQIENQANLIYNNISPENGNLESLELFYSNFINLYENYFELNSGFDQKFDIYEGALD